jgi:hypothetical protein
MRTTLFLAALSLVAACKWTDFDDLSDTTWVRSTDSPNVGSTNYAISIAGVTMGTSGGSLAVISDDTPDYSVIDYGADGVDKIADNDTKLGQHRIAVLTDPPLFTTDGMGNVALAERSTTGGNIAVVFGPATAIAGIEFAAPAAPDAVAFAGGNIVVAAGNTFYTLLPTSQVACASMDTTLAVAAMAADATTLWVWSKTGAFFSIPLTSLTPCNGGMLPASGTTFTTSLMPGAGARVHLVGPYAVLTGHPMGSRAGEVLVVETASLTQKDMLPVEGLRSSTIAGFGGKTYVAVGVPDRAVGGVIGGQVDIAELDLTTGMLSRMPTTLNDAQPEDNQQFGRSVTTMKFNGTDILVVAASSEVFAYYKTALYDALPPR